MNKEARWVEIDDCNRIPGFTILKRDFVTIVQIINENNNQNGFSVSESSVTDEAKPNISNEQTLFLQKEDSGLIHMRIRNNEPITDLRAARNVYVVTDLQINPDNNTASYKKGVYYYPSDSDEQWPMDTSGQPNQLISPKLEREYNSYMTNIAKSDIIRFMNIAGTISLADALDVFGMTQFQQSRLAEIKTNIIVQADNIRKVKKRRHPSSVKGQIRDKSIIEIYFQDTDNTPENNIVIRRLNKIKDISLEPMAVKDIFLISNQNYPGIQYFRMTSDKRITGNDDFVEPTIPIFSIYSNLPAYERLLIELEEFTPV